MTGEKNRFKTGEKLWNLDDKQLKTPVHDAMILWLMDEDNLKALLFNCCFKDKYMEYSTLEHKLNECVNVTIDYTSERPIMSSDTFIAGYADLVVDFHFTKYTSKEICPISSEWIDVINDAKSFEDIEKALQEYHNNPSFNAKKYNEDDAYNTRKYECRDGMLLPIYFIPDDMDESDIIIKSEYCGDLKRFHKLSDFIFNTGLEIDKIDKDYLDWIKTQNKYTREDYVCNCLIEVKPYIDSFGAVLRQINSYKKFYNKRTYLSRGYINSQYCLFTFDKRFDKQFESQGIIVLHPWTSKQEMLEMYGLG